MDINVNLNFSVSFPPKLQLLWDAIHDYVWDGEEEPDVPDPPKILTENLPESLFADSSQIFLDGEGEEWRFKWLPDDKGWRWQYLDKFASSDAWVDIVGPPSPIYGPFKEKT